MVKMMLKYIDWNIKCYCQINKIIDFLKTKISLSNCIVALQELLPEKAERIKEEFSSNFTVLYSLDFYPDNNEFDTDNRRLGVAFIVSKDIKIEEVGVFERCLFPERTMFATVMVDGIKRKIVNFHSITGVSFKMGKAVQYRRFAESINVFKPDILSMDANEPKVDHYCIDKIEYFDQGDAGKGAQIFFAELRKQNLVDLYLEHYNPSNYIYGEPLAVSHIINGKKNRRYDFVFAKRDFSKVNIEYIYDEACDASSDHAIIVAELNY